MLTTLTSARLKLIALRTVQSLGSVPLLTSIVLIHLVHAIKSKGLSLNAVSISTTECYDHEICLFRRVKRAVKMGCY